MYPNLRAEIARYGITVHEIAEACGRKETSIYSKMKGATEFTLGDMEKIKKLLDKISNKDFTLEYLFERSAA